jgi:predicted dehydrogenase/nucleoside-diphosphate-sugar epimerase
MKRQLSLGIGKLGRRRSNEVRPTQVAIVGAGFIAEHHLAILKSLDFINIYAICDIEMEKAIRLQKRYQIPRACHSIEDLLEINKPDVVHVLVPPQFHVEVAEKFLKEKISVFIEKPMGLSSTDCHRIIDLATENGVRIGVNHSAVYHPLYRRLLKDLDSWKLGKIEHVISITNVPLRQLSSGDFSHWMFKHPQNIIFEQAPHPFSQIYGLLGPIIKAKTSFCGNRILGQDLLFYDKWQISMECKKGTAYALLSFGKEFPESSLHVIGQDGSIHLDLWNNTYTVWRKTKYLHFFDSFINGICLSEALAIESFKNLINYVLSTLKLKPPTDTFYLSMKGSIEAFYSAYRVGQLPPISGNHGLAVVEYLEKATETIPTHPEQVKKTCRTPPLPLKDTKILILGATGFIGRHLAERLITEGYSLRVMVWRPFIPRYLIHPRIRVIQGDIRRLQDVERAIQGTEVVYHLVSGAGETWADYEKLFISGTHHVAESCLKWNIQKLIFVSTIAVYDLSNSNRKTKVTEDTPIDSKPWQRNMYARAKIMCEQVLMDMHRSRDLPVTIFRPGIVVGKHGNIQHSGIGMWTCDTHCIAWGAGKNPLPFVLVEDVVSALVSAVSTVSIEGKSFNLVGDVRISAREYIAHLREACQRDIQIHPQSFWKFQAIEILKWIIKASIRKPGNSYPSYHDLRTRALLAEFDCSHAKHILSWKPNSDMDRFLEKAIYWYPKEIY